MGFELNRLMQQYGVSTPTIAPYSGALPPGAYAEMVGTGEGKLTPAQFEQLQQRYATDQSVYDQYVKDYQRRLASTPMYLQEQFQTGTPTTPPAVTFSTAQRAAMAPGGVGQDEMNRKIRDWFAANPNATPAQVREAQNEWGVSDLDIRNAMGLQPPRSAAYRAATAPGGIGLEGMNANIRKYFGENPYVGDQAIGAEMARWGLGGEDLYRAMGSYFGNQLRSPTYGNIDPVARNFSEAQKISLYRSLINQGYTDAEVRAEVGRTIGPQTDADWAYLRGKAFPPAPTPAPAPGATPAPSPTPAPSAGLTIRTGLTTEAQKIAEYERLRAAGLTDAQARTMAEQAYGRQSDADWAYLVSKSRFGTPAPTPAPAQPDVRTQPTVKPLGVVTAAPAVVAAPAAASVRDVKAMLPAGWSGITDPQEKIRWFNQNRVTATELRAAGVPQADIDWMASNGYNPSAAAAGGTAVGAASAVPAAQSAASAEPVQTLGQMAERYTGTPTVRTASAAGGAGQPAAQTPSEQPAGGVSAAQETQAMPAAQTGASWYVGADYKTPVLRSGRLGVTLDLRGQPQAISYYNEAGEKLSSSVFSAPELLRNAQKYGININDALGIGQGLEFNKIGYKPGDLYRGSGSDHGIDFEDLAAGGYGTVYDWTKDPLAAIKGPGALEGLKADQELARSLGLKPSALTRSSAQILPEKLAPTISMKAGHRPYIVNRGGSAASFGTLAEARKYASEFGGTVNDLSALPTVNADNPNARAGNIQSFLPPGETATTALPATQAATTSLPVTQPTTSPAAQVAGPRDLMSLLPSDWGSYDPAKKISWFNAQGVRPDQLMAQGTSQADIDWMRGQGYNFAKGGAVKLKRFQIGGLNTDSDRDKDFATLAEEYGAQPPSGVGAAPITAPAATGAPAAAPQPMNLESMLAKYMQPGAGGMNYGQELAAARQAAQRETAAFERLLQQAIAQPEQAPSKSELYFRLAAAFADPGKTGSFGEGLGKAAGAVAEQKKAEREAARASAAQKLQLGLTAQQARMQGAKEDVTTLRGLAAKEEESKRAVATELLKEWVKKNDPVSSAGKQAQDEGLTPGTPEFQARVKQISDTRIDQQMTQINAMVAQMSTAAAQLALAQKKDVRAEAATKKLTPGEVKLKTETEDLVQSADSALSMLQRAYELSPKAFDASLPDMAQRKVLEAAGSKDKKLIATREMENLLGEQALAKLRATFGGAPTEGERAILMDLSGIGAKSREEREQILKNAFRVLRDRRAAHRRRLEDIKAGLYGEKTEAE
jgi:hypothetical protein